METLTINIPKEVEVKTVKAVLKALGVSVDKGKAAVKHKKSGKEYNPEFVAKIKQGEQDIKDGKGIRVTLDEIWK